MRVKTRAELPWLYYPENDSVRIINAHNFPGGGSSRPLDSSTGVIGAYSTSRLLSSYDGPCMAACLDDGTGTQDFDFDGDLLDVASVEAFAAGAQTRWVTWYDQSGNGRHLTQSVNARRFLATDATGTMQFNGSVPAMLTDSSILGGYASASFAELSTTITLVIRLLNPLNTPRSFMGVTNNTKLSSQGSGLLRPTAWVNNTGVVYGTNWVAGSPVEAVAKIGGGTAVWSNGTEHSQLQTDPTDTPAFTAISIMADLSSSNSLAFARPCELMDTAIVLEGDQKSTYATDSWWSWAE